MYEDNYAKLYGAIIGQVLAHAKLKGEKNERLRRDAIQFIGDGRFASLCRGAEVDVDYVMRKFKQLYGGLDGQESVASKR